MPEPAATSPERKRRRLWLSLGEAASVLAVVIAGLSFWDNRRQHVSEERQAQAHAQADAAFVLTGAADARGSRILLQPVKSSQVIQSQQYLFPKAVLDQPREITAARPAIEADWLRGGLDRALDAAHAPGGGRGQAPVAIVTTYVEDGETRTDRSIYKVGWSWRGRFLLGRRISLEGISLIQRGAKGDLQTQVDHRWAQVGPAPRS